MTDIYTGKVVTVNIRRGDDIVSVSGGGKTWTVITDHNVPVNQRQDFPVPFGTHYFSIVGINYAVSCDIQIDVLIDGKPVETLTASGMKRGVLLDHVFIVTNAARQ